MPCENCNIQFTVFRRKRLCTECRRIFCNNCMVKRNEKILCERCIIFSARPLSKADLLKIKPKDLIFYLQSKHISTKGCVEKEELVDLVLNYANKPMEGQSTSKTHNRFGAQADSENGSNPFDQIKQTCQNLYLNFTDKISDFNFDIKTTNQTSNSKENVTNKSSPIRQCTTSKTTYEQQSKKQEISKTQASSSSTSPSSPISIDSISSKSISIPQTIPSNEINSNSNATNNTKLKINNITPIKIPQKPIFYDSPENGSGCECPDEEIFMKYKSKNKTNSSNNKFENMIEQTSPVSHNNSIPIPIPGPSNIEECPSNEIGKNNNFLKTSENSSGSSFEELGAVGGVSNENEKWQFVEKSQIPCEQNINVIERTENSEECQIKKEVQPNKAFHLHSSVSNLLNNISQISPRKILRRRSDGFIFSGHYNRPKEKDNFNVLNETIENDTDDENLHKRFRKNCTKCGRNKKGFKNRIAKFKQQLETTNMSENDIKQELNAFLKYLESNEKESIDCSDTESNHDSLQENVDSNHAENGSRRESALASFMFADDGIHVYAIDQYDENSLYPTHNNRFINLGDFKSSVDLDDLSVKQLKEILMLNRVDFKGCCEKQELLDRVKRLWTDLKTSPAIDKLPTDDLCKICMDAPIECVILECGHMATCTNCGKVLSECPICRQYIVRVVRFFRA